MNEMKRSHAIALVLLAAIAVYANSLWNGFAYDDVPIIQTNPRVRDLSDLKAIWLTPYWPAFGEQLGLYRPFAIFAYAVQWALVGNAPWLFHLVNVLLHAAVAVFVFLLAEKLFSRTAGVAAGVVFAIHPLHTEAVANVVGQNELWAALGVLAACLIYVRRPEDQGLGWKRATAILALYAMALLSKESAVVLPGLLVLLDFAQGRVRLERASLASYVRKLFAFALAFVLLVAAYLVLRHSVLGTFAGTDAGPGLPHLREQYRLLNAFRAWPEFMRLLFFPLDLSVDYGPGIILPVASLTPMAVLGAGLILLVFALMLATPNAPRAGLAAGWFFISILPVSNLLFPIGVLVAERTLYLPSVAVCLLAGLAWEALRRAREVRTRPLGYALALCVFAFFSARTVQRNQTWDSIATVWRSLNEEHPEAYRAHWLNAIHMWGRGRPDLAEKYFEIAYRIWPRDSQLVTEWGGFYISQQKWDRAIALLEQSRAMTPFSPRTHHYLAQAYLYGGRPQDALETALHADTMKWSNRLLSLLTIASAYEQLGEFDRAAATWQKLVAKKNGSSWLNWGFLARAQARAGDITAARQSAQQALDKAGSNAHFRPVAEKLMEAIDSGCYQSASSGCDPLVGWELRQMPVQPPATPAS